MIVKDVFSIDNSSYMWNDMWINRYIPDVLKRDLFLDFSELRGKELKWELRLSEKRFLAFPYAFYEGKAYANFGRGWKWVGSEKISRDITGTKYVKDKGEFSLYKRYKSNRLEDFRALANRVAVASKTVGAYIFEFNGINYIYMGNRFVEIDSIDGILRRDLIDLLKLIDVVDDSVKVLRIVKDKYTQGVYYRNSYLEKGGIDIIVSL